MASFWTLQLHPISIPHPVSANAFELRPQLGFKKSYRIWNANHKYKDLYVRASSNSSTFGEDNSVKDEKVLIKSKNKAMVALQNQVSRLQETIISLPVPPIILSIKRCSYSKFAVGLCIAASVLIVAVRAYYVARKPRYQRQGSVADLVRRGQLNSDRRGISKTPMYEDPFNNPLVKMSKNNASVEMCGKVYRLAPVTLTREEQSIHQKRRSRAYQWKRPTVFLKEGDPVPADVDPDTVRWIPANHPFATTISDISEDLAQNNVYQKHGVPFRIQAEHQALQKKLQALQGDQKLNNLVIDPGTARNFERPFKPNIKIDDKQVEANGQTESQPKSHESSNNSTSEEKQTQ